ncbi:hypothetical protein I3760_09G158500 [Carya illinoinensis]|nr:hypothetical protein I3760_09G158500 [Carya illinoinensis]
MGHIDSFYITLVNWHPKNKCSMVSCLLLHNGHKFSSRFIPSTICAFFALTVIAPLSSIKAILICLCIFVFHIRFHSIIITILLWKSLVLINLISRFNTESPITARIAD